MARGRPKKIKDAAEINAVVDDLNSIDAPEDAVDGESDQEHVDDTEAAPEIVLAKPFPKAPDATPLHPAFTPQAPVSPVVSRPAEYTSPQALREALEPYIARGMRIEYLDEDGFEIAVGLKNDSGTLHQPLRNIMKCVYALMAPARVIKESDQLQRH
jgi:hypothetical protein